jgi:TRAP-type C4-dicarboxylate transport system substrate-binding protein
VQKYVTVIDYMRWGLLVLMNADQWKKLNPDEQKALAEAAAETGTYGTKLSNDTVTESVTVLKKNGMEIIVPDLAPFRKTAAEVIARIDGEMWEKGLYEKIQAIK